VTLPIAKWLSRYTWNQLTSDAIAALIVAIMLIPQSLAYALLAGMPPELGLYASILPLIAYAVFGTSSTLSVGPVAIASLMTAAALADVVEQGTADYIAAGVTLAALSGLLLLLAGIFRLGILANFLSHSVVSAFITASAIIIALSQLRHLIGIEMHGDNLIELISSLLAGISEFNQYTAAIGLGVLGLLVLLRATGESVLVKLGLGKQSANILLKTAPVFAVLFTILLVSWLQLESRDVAIVGEVPAGLPGISLPGFSLDLARELLLPAALISLIGYVESISVGRTLGGRRRERVNNDQELIGLGAANLASSVSGAFPVTGGFSRSVVNFDAGAVTQMAGILAAVLIALVSLFLTPLLYHLPNATLAATIIVAVVSLIDFSVVKKTWRFSRSDWSAVVITLVMTLLAGVEAGVSCGVLLSLGLHLLRTAKPHIAEVGLVEGSEHFRNVRRFKVATVPEILTLRIDESLFFANVTVLEELVYKHVFENDQIAHVILMCTAVNELDYSALETLEELNQRLLEDGITLHLSEVKGPVQDRLQRSNFFKHLSGRVYLSQHEAFRDLLARFNYQLDSHPHQD